MSTARRFIASLSVGAAALSLTATVFGADRLSIRRLAPEKSLIVMGLDDIGATRERFGRTPLAGWWNSKEVQDASKEWREELDKGLEEMTQELGVPRESITCPGSLGFSLFAQLNEESGVEEPAFIAFVDWSDDEEKFAQLYDAAAAKLEKEKSTPFTIEEVKGRRVYVFGGELDGEGAADDDGMGGGDEEEFDASMSMFGIETCCVTRDKGRLLAASGVAQMEDLLVALESGQSKSIADSEDFRGTMDLIGGSPDLYAVVLFSGWSSIMGPMAGPEMALAGPFMSKLFGDTRGMGMGIALDGKRAPLEQSVGLFVPGTKVGLLSLLAAGGVEKAPSIVPAEAISYGRMNLKIGELMRIVDDFVEGLPEMERDQVKQMTEPFAPALRTAFGAMGPGMHYWSTVRQPVTEESQRTTWAIGVSDQKAAQTLMQTFGPMMGMAPRDFLGHTIFSAEEMPAAVGYGGTFMFMGETESVEQSLRAVGAADAASIESDPTYRQAMTAIAGNDLVGYGFSNTIAALEMQQQVLKQVDEMLRDADPHAALGDEGDVLDEAMDLEKLGKLMTPELAADYFGPSIWTLRSVKSGFRMEFDLLAPMKDSKGAARAGERR